MKKIILAITLLTFAGSQVQTAKAGGWGIAAGVLGGVAAGTIIGESIAHPYYAPNYYYAAPPPTYYYPPQTYQAAPPPVAYQPAPPYTVYQPAPAVVYAQPVYVRPVPVVTFGFGFGPRYYGGYHHYRHW